MAGDVVEILDDDEVDALNLKVKGCESWKCSDLDLVGILLEVWLWLMCWVILSKGYYGQR